MRIGLGLGITHFRNGAFTPAALPGLSAWYDPSDLSTLFQDVAMTIPVTSDGQPVAAMKDKSGNGRHAVQATASARPLYRNASGVKWLEFDGVDDWMYVPSFDLSATNALTFALAVRRAGETGIGILIELSGSTNFSTNPGSFCVIAPHSTLSAPNLMVMAGTSANGTVKIGESMTAASYVLSGRLDRSKTSSAAAIDLRRNGSNTSSVVTDTTAFSGNFGSYPFYIGKRGGSTLPFTGRLYGIALVSRKLSDPELTRVESWMQGKLG